MTINDHVKSLLKQHIGGEAFFDALDNSFRNSENLMSDFAGFVLNNAITSNFIVSGNFGRAFANYIRTNKFFDSIITVNGNLRKGEPIDNLQYFNVQGKNFIFLDDSYYLGRTRDVIKAELERNGARLVHTFVLYDGSQKLCPQVSSLYRYYDHH